MIDHGKSKIHKKNLKRSIEADYTMADAKTWAGYGSVRQKISESSSLADI